MDLQEWIHIAESALAIMYSRHQQPQMAQLTLGGIKQSHGL